MSARSSLEVFEAFVEGRLSKDEWTHEAHLITCVVTLADRNPAQAVEFLRHAIQTHNCGIGIANTETSGYHETLTCYYVTAVAEATVDHPGSIEDRVVAALANDLCDRKAPLKFWSNDRLFSVPARLGWVEPDLASPPWPIVSC